MPSQTGPSFLIVTSWVASDALAASQAKHPFSYFALCLVSFPPRASPPRASESSMVPFSYFTAYKIKVK